MSESGVKRLRAATLRTDLAMFDRVDARTLDPALTVAVRFTLGLKPDEFAAVFHETETDEPKAIGFDPRAELTAEQLEYLLVHEIRHVMQSLSGVSQVDDGSDYMTDPRELDADDFARTVTGLVRPVGLIKRG